MARNGTNKVTAGSPPVPGLIFPEMTFDGSDYAKIQMRFDLYDDSIIATRYQDGTAGPTFAVDPADFATALSGIPISSGPLPRNCLAWGRQDGAEYVAVYIEPKIWPVSVQGQKETWFVPMPGLVFIGNGKGYALFALADDNFGFGWPGPSTKLYNAPAPNTNNGVCQGNAPFPKASAKTIWGAVEVFFQSGFNNHLANRKSQKYPDNILDMWRELHEAAAEVYPTADLVEAGQTLGQVLGEEKRR